MLSGARQAWRVHHGASHAAHIAGKVARMPRHCSNARSLLAVVKLIAVLALRLRVGPAQVGNGNAS